MDADAQPDPQAQLRKAIVQIMMDSTLTEAEKAQKRQALMMGGWAASKSGAEEKKDTGEAAHGVGSLDENLKCGVCLNLCERPVTAPCQHNFCLACFNKWVNQGKRTCPTCRAPYGDHFARNPRINTALILALRIAKNPAKAAAANAQTKAVARADNESRPDQAYVTDRAVRAGLANAASGKIMVTTGNDHFGPIEAAHDPTRNRGVLVGDHWVNRLHCRQWGAHFPHVAGIAGQANTGAQSVVLSGGYEDDVDCGEWFLYTGSGGRDLSGNKRTSKIQSSDQVFEMMNKALLTSCLKGLPVRVVRSYKEKSTYAPTTDTPVRYDGVYRILRAWRKPGIQKQLVCRYLFMRCDNSPAPWSSEETGDGLSLELPEEAVKDMASAVGQVHSMTDTPYWDWVPSDKQWGWAKPSPSQGNTGGGTRKAINPAAKLRKALSEHEKALKEFRCLLCKDTLTDPLSTPCGHNFCKACLDKKFAGQGDVQPANASRSLRVRKVIKPCPACKADVCDFLSSAQVNREMTAVIQKLCAMVEEARTAAAAAEAAAGQEGGEEEGAGEGEEEGVESEEQEGEVDEQERSSGGAAAGCGSGSGSGAVLATAAPKARQADQGSTAGTSAHPASTAPPATLAPSSLASAQEVVALGASSSSEAQGEGEAGAAPASQCSAAGASSSAMAGGQPAGRQAVGPPAFQYARQLSALMEEFPAAETGLVEGLLVDQAGDVLDVRVVLRRLLAPPKPPRSPSAASKTKTGKPPRASKGKAGAKPQSAVTLTMADTPACPTGGEVAAGAAAAPPAAQPAAPSATGAQSEASDHSHRTQHHHQLTSHDTAQPPDAPGAAARLPTMPSDSCAAVEAAVEAVAIEKVVAKVGGAKRKAGPARGRVAKAAALGKGSGVSGGSEQDSAEEEAVRVQVAGPQAPQPGPQQVAVGEAGGQQAEPEQESTDIAAPATAVAAAAATGRGGKPGRGGAGSRGKQAPGEHEVANNSVAPQRGRRAVAK